MGFCMGCMIGKEVILVELTFPNACDTDPNRNQRRSEKDDQTEGFFFDIKPYKQHSKEKYK
jgi:hypothetical protein